MADVDITVGADTSAATAGLASLRNELAKTQASLSSAFSGFLSPAALVTTALTVGFKAVIDYGDKIFELAKRFGIGTTELQQFGNAAEKNGASLESLARGFNRLDVAIAQARAGNKEMQKALEDLNIKNWADRSLTLSDAMLKIGTSAMEANDMVRVLGKSGTELRETLHNLADGSEQLSAAINPNTIKALHILDDTWKSLVQDLKVTGAYVVTGILGPIKKGMDDINNSIMNMVAGAKLIGKGSISEGVTQFFAGRAPQGRPQVPQNVPTKEEMVPTGEDLKLVNEMADEEERAAEAEQKAADARAQWLASAARAVDIEKGNVAVATLRLQGENQLADLLEIQLNYQTKINDAYNDGNAELAATLKLEENLAIAAKQKADKEERAANAIKEQQARNEAAATGIREAAGALAAYNLRIGTFAPTYGVGGGPENYGAGGTLRGPALQVFNQIQGLMGQLSIPGQTTGQLQGLVNRIENLIPYFERQIHILESIDKRLTPQPGSIYV
jgi:hypothetical protein